MAKIALLGDTHLGVRSGSKYFLDFQTNWFNKFSIHAKMLNVEAVIQVGDFNDVRKKTDNNVLEWHLTHFKSLVQNLDVPWHINVGNHDIFYRDSNEIYSTAILEHILPNHVKVYPRFETVNIAGTDFFFIPWLDEQNRNNLASALMNTKAEYAIGHLDVQGSPMYLHTISEHGMDAAKFSQFKTVFTGHFHTVSKQRNIQYLGTPYHLTWSDFPDGDNRGWWLFDTVTGEYELVKNESYETLFALVEYNDDIEYTDDDLKCYEGNILKVIVNKKENERNFKKFIKALQSVSVIDYTIIDNTILKQSDSTPKTFDSKNQPSTVDLLKGFVAQRMNVEQVDSGMDTLIQDIYSKAANNV